MTYEKSVLSAMEEDSKKLKVIKHLCDQARWYYRKFYQFSSVFSFFTAGSNIGSARNVGVVFLSSCAEAVVLWCTSVGEGPTWKKITYRDILTRSSITNQISNNIERKEKLYPIFSRKYYCNIPAIRFISDLLETIPYKKAIVSIDPQSRHLKVILFC